MNKTLLLVLCDFLLLNLIHFTAWESLDEEVEQQAATGGSTDEVISRPGMGDISRDLEFVTHQYKATKADLKDAEIDNAALKAETKASEEQSAKNLAAAIKNANAWKNVYDESSKSNEVLEAATSQLQKDQKIALAEIDKQEALKEAANTRVDNLQKDVVNLRNTTNQLTGQIGDLNTKIDGLNVNLTKAEGNADAARKARDKAIEDYKLEQARAEKALIAQKDAENKRDKAVSDAATTRRNAATQIANAEAAANKLVAETKATTTAQITAAQNAANKQVADAKTTATAQIKAAELAATNQVNTMRTFAAQQITQAKTQVAQAEQKVKVAETKVEAAQAETKAATVKVAAAEQKLAVTTKENEALENEVTVEKTEKVIAQKAAAQLRDEIAKKIPDQPINANMMATLFLQNKVQLDVSADRPVFDKASSAPTVLIEVAERGQGAYVHAVTHVAGTPFDLPKQPTGFRASTGAINTPNAKRPHRLHHVRFLNDDPRLIVIPVGPVGSDQVKALGVTPYKLAKNPFKFPKAFIMGKSGRKFGEMEFKIDPENPGYVKVDRIFWNFGGKFNPGKGDMVFSQFGELIGIMANNKYCRVINNTTPANAILFGPADSTQVSKILRDLRKKIDTKPFVLR